MTTTYAIFKTPRAAQFAQRWLRTQVGEDVQISVIDQPERLSHHVVPLAMTDARSGAVFGSALVAGVTALAFGLGLVAMRVYGPEPLLPVVPTWALCVALGAILGGLAGALSFSSDSKRLLHRLRGQLRRNRPILLISGPGDHSSVLERFEPMAVGILSRFDSPANATT